MSGNAFGYGDEVWRRFRNPGRAGTFDQREALTAVASTPASRNVLRLQVKMDGARIADARFQAYGCPTTIAVGSWLADWLVGRTVDELAGFSATLPREALEIPEQRIHCALLAEDAVRILAGHGVQAGRKVATR